MSRFPPLVPFVLLLAGCGNGWPWSHGPDPYAAATAKEAEPLTETCRAAFVKDLHGTEVTWPGGPTITRDGNTITIRLEAQPTDPDALHALRYYCTFNGGVLGPHGRDS